MAAATSVQGPPGRLGILKDSSSSLVYPGDTGSAVSILPYTSSAPTHGPAIMTPDKTPIRCWGHQLATVKTSGHAWAWNFLQANVAFPILGSDFLGTIKMMVDISGRSLVLQYGQSVPLATQPSGPLASCVGVAAATPDPGSSPPSLPTVEALEFGPPAAQQNHLRRSWGLW